MSLEDMENEIDKSVVERLLDDLDEVLDPEGDDVGAMSDTAIHGYLSAVACSAVPIPKEAWINGLFGDGETTPTFSSPEAGEKITAVLEKILASIRIELEEDEYLAVVDYDEQHGDRVEDSTDWCRGFHLALDDHYSEMIDADDRLWEIVEPVVYLSDSEGVEEGLPQSEIDELRDLKSDFIDELEECVYELYDFWHPEHALAPDDTPTIPEIDTMVGPDRNAPCSCGSGKKFKRCCGRLL